MAVKGYSMRVQARWAQVRRKTHRALHEALSYTAHQGQLRARLAIQTGPKTGRIYERGESEISFTTKAGVAVKFTANRGKASDTHQASAPGEAPANDTGTLAGSIQVEFKNPLLALITVGAEYAVILEFGGVHVEPRPFLGPAVDSLRDEFETAVVTLLSRME